MKINDSVKNYRFRYFKWFLLILICLIVLFGIIRISEEGFKSKPYKHSKKNRIVIGFAMGTLKEERWFKDRDLLIAKARERGFDIEWVNANENDLEQVNQVKYLLSKNIDILVIVPNNLDKCASAVNIAKKRGIKVISYDRLVRKSDIDLYVSFDNYMVGELMAKALLQKVPEGNYVFLLGDPGDYNVQMIKDGYEKVLGPYFKNNKINKLLEEYCYNWRKEYAYNYVNALLDKHKIIDAILASNDSLAEGAITALSEKRLAGIIPVTGQDADISACQRIVKGTQLMTVYKPIDKLADLTLDLIQSLVNGNSLKPTRFINNGYKNVPTFFIEPIAVYNFNINQTVIKDNFHTLEEIYMFK